MKTVTLNVVFEWTCDNCGNTNLIRPMPVDDPQMREDILESKGIEPDRQGELVSMNPVVTCKHCSTKSRIITDG